MNLFLCIATAFWFMLGLHAIGIVEVKYTPGLFIISCVFSFAAVLWELIMHENDLGRYKE